RLQGAGVSVDADGPNAIGGRQPETRAQNGEHAGGAGGDPSGRSPAVTAAGLFPRGPVETPTESDLHAPEHMKGAGLPPEAIRTGVPVVKRPTAPRRSRSPGSRRPAAATTGPTRRRGRRATPVR